MPIVATSTITEIVVITVLLTLIYNLVEESTLVFIAVSTFNTTLGVLQA